MEVKEYSLTKIISLALPENIQYDIEYPVGSRRSCGYTVGEAVRGFKLVFPREMWFSPFEDSVRTIQSPYIEGVSLYAPASSDDLLEFFESFIDEKNNIKLRDEFSKPFIL